MTFYYHYPAYYQPFATVPVVGGRFAYPVSTTYVAPRYTHPLMAIPAYGANLTLPVPIYPAVNVAYVPTLTHLP